MCVPGIDVLIATAKWLLRRKVLPYQFSVASGKGIDPENSEWWQIECKPAAAGAPILPGAILADDWIETVGHGSRRRPVLATKMTRA